jgi:hypothetical protein
VKAVDAVRDRRTRIGVLGGQIAGWAGIAVGALLDNAVFVAVGVALAAATTLLTAKALAELVVAVTKAERARNRLDTELDERIGGVQGRVEGLAANVADENRVVDARLASLAAAGERLRIEQDSTTAQIDGLRILAEHLDRRLDAAATAQGTSDGRLEAFEGAFQELRDRATVDRSDADTTRAVVVELRAQVDRLGARTRAAWVDSQRLLAVAETDIDAPRLSIAIPAFERPALLAECLASVATEVASCPPGTVEVCITDDASPDPAALDIALDFAERFSYASLRSHATNIGSERNVLAAPLPCRGEFVLILGNDDVLSPGSLAEVLRDIEASPAPVMLYSKRRMRQDGSAHPEVRGSIPIDLSPGQSHRFDTFQAAAERQGLISTFGFIGPAVVRRKQFVAVDAGPYLGLTMYAHVFVMAEAFAGQPVFYRNLPTITQRSPTVQERYAGVIGRPEGKLMRPGEHRLARTFGTTFAAALQRAVDRGALDLAAIGSMYERQLTDLPVIEWIARNRALDPAVDERIDLAVLEDAERLLASFGDRLGVQTE